MGTCAIYCWRSAAPHHSHVYVHIHCNCMASWWIVAWKSINQQNCAVSLLANGLTERVHQTSTIKDSVNIQFRKQALGLFSMALRRQWEAGTGVTQSICPNWMQYKYSIITIDQIIIYVGIAVFDLPFRSRIPCQPNTYTYYIGIFYGEKRYIVKRGWNWTDKAARQHLHLRFLCHTGMDRHHATLRSIAIYRLFGKYENDK